MTARERIDELIANTPDRHVTPPAQLRHLIHAADPEITEEWK